VTSFVYEEWSAAGSHQAMISEKQIAFFQITRKVFDPYEESSELLFARKFSDDSLALPFRIDQMVARKGDC
jgi:hypothetical protein